MLNWEKLIYVKIWSLLFDSRTFLGHSFLSKSIIKKLANKCPNINDFLIFLFFILQCIDIIIQLSVFAHQSNENLEWFRAVRRI